MSIAEIIIPKMYYFLECLNLFPISLAVQVIIILKQEVVSKWILRLFFGFILGIAGIVAAVIFNGGDFYDFLDADVVRKTL